MKPLDDLQKTEGNTNTGLAHNRAQDALKTELQVMVDFHSQYLMVLCNEEDPTDLAATTAKTKSNNEELQLYLQKTT